MHEKLIDMNFLRWVLFIPLSIIAIGAIEWLLAFILFNVSQLATIWIIAIFFLGYSLLWKLASSVFTTLIAIVLNIAPNVKVASIIFNLFILGAVIFDCICYAGLASSENFSVWGYIVLYFNMLCVWIALLLGVNAVGETAEY